MAKFLTEYERAEELAQLEESLLKWARGEFSHTNQIISLGNSPSPEVDIIVADAAEVTKLAATIQALASIGMYLSDQLDEELSPTADPPPQTVSVSSLQFSPSHRKDS